MSTHNIGFYEDLKKIIFELSSNIIKYAPYFFCCIYMYQFLVFAYISNFLVIRLGIPDFYAQSML